MKKIGINNTYMLGLSQDEWLIILAVLLMVGVYVIITMKRKYRIHREKAKAALRKEVEAEPVNALDKSVTDAAPDVIGYPKPAGKGVKNIVPDDSMVSTYYKNAADTVPMQYSKLPIGACPYSKPHSVALPIANVPMCMASEEGNNMFLGGGPLVGVPSSI